ncbi:ABC transporter ATP-binding protein [Oleiharenicola lentus]|uniref:ABC transporter ATP-binding protein n=1 Tax=Oleiharenicola lentus TaxID=2508720 RepID=UPI003F67A736
MTQPIISARGVSKRYQLGQIGMSSFRDELERLSARFLRRSISQTKPALTGEFWALKDVEFDIFPGEIVGVIGRNGAGKSTLLKILSRTTEPTAGEITMHGRVGSLLEVGTGFHPELSGRQNIFLNGAILGMSRAEVSKKFAEIVEFAEIAAFIDTPVKRYSSGMYVRLAFAVAAHLEPEILILDEVLAVGDADFQRKCLNRMSEISTTDGRTILLVSHNMQALRRLCTKCLYLENGRSVGIMPVEDAIARYSQHLQSSPLRVSLVDRPRGHGEGTRVRLVELGTPDGRAIRYGQSAEFYLDFKLTEPVRRFAVGLGFATREGQRVLTLDSDTMTPALDFEPGSYRITLGLEFWPLPQSQYHVSCAAIEGSSYPDALVDVALWDVLPAAEDETTHRSSPNARPRVSVRVAALNIATPTLAHAL